MFRIRKNKGKMSGLIPDKIIDSVLDKVDIVEVISSHISLKKIGRNFKANCPFHNEKTPSFVVSPEKQIFHCFGCGQGGNAIGFLVKYDKLSFPEAVRTLAETVGIKIPEPRSRENASLSFSEKLVRLNEIARDFFKFNLHARDHSFCPKYLKERGITENSINFFQLGYAPNSWEGLIKFFQSKNVLLESVHKAGLVLPSEKQTGYYDRFRNRVIFPIFDIRDRVIAFGARALGNSQPKYINSPETPLYIKGKHLYGLNFAKKYIRERDYAIIVEGYMDLITPFQHGIRNIVATLGTALTPEQGRLIKRFTKTVVMIYDSDKAGEEASLRSLDLLVSLDLNVRVAVLPKGYDPDSFVKKEGKKALDAVIKSSKDLFDYKMALLTKRYNKDGVRGKTAIATLMLPTIALISNEILKVAFLKKLSETLSIDESALKAELKKTKTGCHSYGERIKYAVPTKSAARGAEMLLLSIILDDPESLSLIEKRLGQYQLKDANIKRIIDVVSLALKDNKKIDPSKIINHFKDGSIENLISEAVSIRETIANKEKTIDDCITKIARDNIKDQLKMLQDEIHSAQKAKNSEVITRLVSEYNALIKTHVKR